MTDRQLLDICRLAQDFLAGVINTLESGQPAGEKKEPTSISEDKDLENVHKQILALCKVNYPLQTENEYGKVINRRKEKRFIFAFRPGVLEKFLLEHKIQPQTYATYARATGKLCTQHAHAYKLSTFFDDKPVAVYAVYLDSMSEPVYSSPNEETYTKLIQLFKENEQKFDKRGKNEYGRRVSGYHPKVCYALLPIKTGELVKSVGGDMDTFIPWARDNGKLVTENENKNTILIDFNNHPQEMYGFLNG